MSTSRTYTAGAVLTAAQQNDLAQGTIGYAQITASQTGVTTVVDITGLAVTVTPTAGRRIRIVASVATGSTVATDVVRVSIKEGATNLQIRDVVPGVVSGTSGNINLEFSAIIQPTAAAHTYKLTLERLAGTGTCQASGNATWPSFILAEDIGV